MRHFPGPWNVEPAYARQGVEQPSRYVLDKSQRDVARIRGGEPETDGNARLIAAAPELFEALTRSFCDEFHDGVLCSWCRAEGKGCLRLAALAKVEGRP